jgi:hypothetical protein
MTTHALHFQSHLSSTRFESRLESLDRWGSGSNPRFLRRRPRNGWKKRSFESQVPVRSAARPSRQASKVDSLLRQSLEVGLFGAYMLIFMASLWMLA